MRYPTTENKTRHRDARSTEAKTEPSPRVSRPTAGLDHTAQVAIHGDLSNTSVSSSTVLEVDALNVFYGEFHAVKDLSFHVERGELYALLGTNGAGKTSALEVIEGHRQGSSGTVRVFGARPTDRRAVRPRMGMMLQESGFADDLTVFESVRLIGRLTRRADAVERVLEVVDLTHKAHTRVSQLSGGEKRRLDFAAAVYGRPELLILDEPTTGLDIQSRDAVWNAVEQMRANGTTVILTTHYLEEAQQRADRIGLMHDGAFRAQGTVAELTRALPSSIRFSLPSTVPAPPRSAKVSGQSYLIETFDLQADLKQVLDWSDAHGVDLIGLSAAPTRLDDVFRALDPHPTPTNH